MDEDVKGLTIKLQPMILFRPSIFDYHMQEKVLKHNQRGFLVVIFDIDVIAFLVNCLEQVEGALFLLLGKCKRFVRGCDNIYAFFMFINLLPDVMLFLSEKLNTYIIF